MDTRPRNANGTFQKGQPPPVEANRKKGVANKITHDIREGAIAGFARHGSNGRGEGGFAGFCYYLAKKHPKAAARIVEKLLPLHVNGTGLAGAGASVVVNVQSIPSGSFLSAESIERLAAPGLTLEHQSTEPLVEPSDIEIIAQEEQPSPDPVAQLEAKLLEMGHDKLVELARVLNVGQR